MYKQFSEGWESSKDDQHPGQPVSVSAPQTMTKINEIVCEDRRMNTRIIAETINADKETTREILHDKVNMKKVREKLVSKNLTPDQKLIRPRICSDFLEVSDEDPELKENIIT